MKDFREGLLPVPNCTAGLGDTMRDSQLQALPYGKETPAVRGLSAKKNADGTCSFVLSKKMKGRKSPLRLKLGVWPDVSIDQAEAKAARYRTFIDQGVDPRDHEVEVTRANEKQKAEKVRKAITLRQLHDEFMRNRMALERHTDSTRKSYHQVVPQVWEPFFDDPIHDITGPRLFDHYEYWVSQRISDRTGKPAVHQIKKGIRYLKAEFDFAIEQKEYIAKNPCDVFKKQITLQADESRNHLTIRETEELWEWLGKLLVPDANIEQWIKSRGISSRALNLHARVGFDLVALELLSGVRQVEARELGWDQVYLEKNHYQQEDAEGPFFKIKLSKQKRPFGIPITSQMKGVFERRKAARTNDYVFPSYRSPDLPLAEDRGAFQILKKLMPPEALRHSDKLNSNVLRHTFATTTFNLWKDLSLADMMTGHHSKHHHGVATHVYVHTLADNYREKFQEVNDVLTGSLPEEVRLRIQKEFEELETRLDAEGFEKSLEGVAAFRSSHGP